MTSFSGDARAVVVVGYFSAILSPLFAGSVLATYQHTNITSNDFMYATLHRGGSRNFHLGRSIKGQANFG